MTSNGNGDKLRLPTWMWGVLGSLFLIVLVGSFHLISRLIILETQVTENKKDREKQVEDLEERNVEEFERMERRNNREFENLDGQIDELESQIMQQRRDGQ